MANMNFDFNKINRSFFTVTLTDGKKLLVKMPKKGTFGKLAAVQDMDTDKYDNGRRNGHTRRDRCGSPVEQSTGRKDHNGIHHGSVRRGRNVRICG